MSSNRIQRAERINYRILNSTGERSSDPEPRPPEVDQSDLDPQQLECENQSELELSTKLDQLSLSEMPPSSELAIETNIIIDEVSDTIDENPIHPDYATNLQSVIDKLCSLRTSLRRQDQLIKAEGGHHLSDSITSTFSNIKEYIKQSKDCMLKVELADKKQVTDASIFKERSTYFAIKDIRYKITELQKIFNKELENLTNAELIELKSDILTQNDLLNKISKKYESILQSPLRKADMLHDVQDIGKRYENLLKSKSKYEHLLNEIIISKDVYKQQLFDTSKLNISLEKFSGYNDSNDFYTFKTNFNKINERTTPKHLLGDLLKNNYLKEPAYSLVKSLENIDQIWDRLQFASGDVKTMLSQKLKQLSNMEPIYRCKNPQTLAHSLSKIITLINEMVMLADEHNLEPNLYYSDGLHRLYGLLDDSRLSRWLRSIANDTMEPKETWKKFINYLETEQQLQQQKVSIIETSKFTRNQTKLPDHQKGNKHLKHGYSNYPSANPICFICESQDGQNDHLATSGPAGTKIIQYHTCMKFAELNPADRFSILKDKGYCYQCLYPGADVTTGKHKEGKCQRDFVCPHTSHHRSTVRKHVLVCEEHKESSDNKDLLDKYKLRYMKNSKLPSFAKNISLTFHNCFKSDPQPCLENPTSTDDQEIYLLQKVTINNNDFTVFFDNGCNDFLIKYSAIKKLGKEARKESSRVTHIGGVGNTTTCSTLGSYSVNVPMVNGKYASLSGICIDQITTTFPEYPLNEVYKSIQENYFGDPSILPVPSSSVGGDVHLMIGIKYIRYHPKLIFQLPSGLGIYESVFLNTDGGQGVIGGPHPIFTAIQK